MCEITACSVYGHSLWFVNGDGSCQFEGNMTDASYNVSIVFSRPLLWSDRMCDVCISNNNRIPCWRVKSSYCSCCSIIPSCCMIVFYAHNSCSNFEMEWIWGDYCFEYTICCKLLSFCFCKKCFDWTRKFYQFLVIEIVNICIVSKEIGTIIGCFFLVRSLRILVVLAETKPYLTSLRSVI